MHNLIEGNPLPAPRRRCPGGNSKTHTHTNTQNYTVYDHKVTVVKRWSEHF